MLQTSDDYKDVVLRGARTSSARVYFGVVDVTAAEDALPTSNTSQPFTDVGSIVSEQYDPSYKVATFEDGYFKLDGSMILMPDDVSPSYKLGWWSKSMSDENGDFSDVPSFDGASWLNGPPISFGNSVCLSVLIYPTNLSSRHSIFSTRRQNLPGCWQLEVGIGSGGVNRVAVSGVGTWVVESIDNAIKLNEWNHIVFYRHDQDLALFVNGMEVQYYQVTPSYNFIDNGDDILIGRTSPLEGQPSFYGMISNVLIKSSFDIDYSEYDLKSLEVSGAITWRSTEPVISIDFDSLHSSLGLGLFFGTDDFPVNFTVMWYNGSNLIAQEDVIGNDQRNVNLNVPIENYNRITIRFTKTRVPFRYARLMCIEFGLQEVFGNEDIISGDIVEEIDPSGSTLSINTLSVSVLNKDQKFNMLNPNGIYSYLQKRQKIKAQSGLLLDNGTVEYVDLGTFYLDKWRNSTGLKATLEATDVIGLLDKTTYYMSPFWSNEPIQNVINHILSDAGKFSFTISPDVANERVNGYIGVKSHRDALIDVLISARCSARVMRDGTISIFRVNYSSSDYEVNYSTILGEPAIEQLPLITSVQVTEYSYLAEQSDVELYRSDFNINGTQEVVITLDKPAREILVSVEGGSIVGDPITSAVAVRATLSSTGTVNVVIRGKPYTESSRLVSASQPLQAGEVSQTAEVSNTNRLIVGNGAAVAQFVLDYQRRRIKQTFDFWCNPALQAGDVIDVETMFQTFRSGAIESQKIQFAPGLKATMEVVG